MMEEKKTIKISLSSFFLMLAILIIIIMTYFIYKFYNEKVLATKEIEKLNTQVISLENTVNNSQDTINTISNNTNNSYSNSNSLDAILLDTTYSNNGIEFKYPSTFNKTDATFNESGYEAIEDNNKNRFQIQDEKISSSMELKDIIEREKTLGMPDGSNYRTLVKDEEYTTLSNGIKGYRFESTTQDNAYQIIFMTQKDTTAYQFTFTINDKSTYDNYIEIANKILDSIEIK
ncbi:MAG: hypothetical protein IJE05_07015 [Clostridia bacterium]|nr:hypothetical protein [Clostridia bacterium]